MSHYTSATFDNINATKYQIEKLSPTIEEPLSINHLLKHASKNEMQMIPKVFFHLPYHLNREHSEPEIKWAIINPSSTQYKQCLFRDTRPWIY